MAPVAPVAPVAPAAPVAPVAPAASSGLGMLSLMKMFSNGFSMESLMQLIPEGGAALAKATDTLNGVTPYLPTLLANVPPTVKNDIAGVNRIIAEVCNKLVNEVRPQTWTYYSNEGIQASCRYINEKANEVLLAFDDPSIVQNYVNKLNGLSNSLQTMV